MTHEANHNPGRHYIDICCPSVTKLQNQAGGNHVTAGWPSRSSISPVMNSIFLAQLMRNEADVAPADFTVTSLRSTVVDYLASLTEIHMRFVIANPADSYNWTAFIEPLTWPVWMVVGTLIMVLPVFVATSIQYGLNMNFLFPVTIAS